MTISLTIFKSKYDSHTHKRMDFADFDAFEKLLYELSKVVYKSKSDAPLISPATYATDEIEHTSKVKESDKRKSPPFYHRKNVNVVDWGGWCALDIDTWVPETNLKDELYDKFGKYRYVCYSTASSTHDAPKFRIVFRLDGRLPHDKIRQFWHALAMESTLEVDPQCKDLSRMYYVPADYRTGPDTNSFIFSNLDGESINPDELIEKHPMPAPRSNNFFDDLPEEVQNQIIEHRKQSLNNRTYSWTSYRNCPFWPKRMAQEYMTISDSGWYHKMYQIMVATASQAVRKQYPITSVEIAQLCFEFDMDTGGWYKDRNLETEANRALDFVYRNM